MTIPEKKPYARAASRPASFEALLDAHGSFAWVTRGNSMRPLLRPGRDVVEIRRPEGRLKRWDVALYRVPDAPESRCVLHRVLAVRPDHYLVCGDNNAFLERVPDAWVIGVMTGLTRAGKRVDLDGWRYRTYVRLWGGHYLRRQPFKRAAAFVKRPLRPLWRALRKRH